jgi:hypothetical protein
VIKGFIGRPGSGKTYHMTRDVLKEADRGNRCFTNWDVAHENVWRFREDQLLDLPPGKIYIDEAHLWFSARQALNLPPSWLAMLSQTRKAGWDLTWCAQHETRVDRVLRDVTSWMYLCSAWGKVDGHPFAFQLQQWEPENFRRKSLREGNQWFMFEQRVADAYDTFERLTVAAHAQKDSDAYAKKSTTYGARMGSKSKGAA